MIPLNLNVLTLTNHVMEIVMATPRNVEMIAFLRIKMAFMTSMTVMDNVSVQESNVGMEIA